MTSNMSLRRRLIIIGALLMASRICWKLWPHLPWLLVLFRNNLRLLRLQWSVRNDLRRLLEDSQSVGEKQSASRRDT